MDVTVSRPPDAECLIGLAADAEADGHRMVTQLIAEWRDGSNGFRRPGESLYVASIRDEVVGVAGLNVDPYVDDPRTGRVRRLYVAVEHRRHAVGSLLVSRIIGDARRAFDLLRLRTRNPEAAAFYESHGFVPVVGDDICTHRLVLRG